MGDEYLRIEVDGESISRIVAKQLMQNGMDIEEVIKRTGLTREQILREYEEPSPVMTTITKDGPQEHKI